MPQLVTPEGAPVELSSPAPDVPQKTADDINRDFSRAMAAEDPSAVPSPPQREPRAEPEAGKRPRGRPRKNPEEKPRTEAAPAVSQKTDKDYTGACASLTTLGWATLAAIPYTTPYAAVIDANQEQLVAALNAGAQNNAKIRDAIEKASAGGGGVWAMQLAAVSVNMSMNALEIMRDPETREAARKATQEKFRAFLRAQGVQVQEEQADASDG